MAATVGQNVTVGDLEGLGAVTNIYKNGSLMAAVPGIAIGWLDNSQLLVRIYVVDPKANFLEDYSGTAIYSSSGSLIASPLLPELFLVQPVDPTSVYSPERNAIFSLTTGQTVWTTFNTAPDNGSHLKGAVSGQYVVFAAKHRVYVSTH